MNCFIRLVPEADIFNTTLYAFKNLVKKYVSDAVIGSMSSFIHVLVYTFKAFGVYYHSNYLYIVFYVFVFVVFIL